MGLLLKKRVLEIPRFLTSSGPSDSEFYTGKFTFLSFTGNGNFHTNPLIELVITYRVVIFIARK